MMSNSLLTLTGLAAHANPHGYHGDCNFYCQEGGHAVSILAEPATNPSIEIMVIAQMIIASVTPYYTSLGWQVVRARPHEGDAATALRGMHHPDAEGPVLIDPGTTKEIPLAQDVLTFCPWVLFVEPTVPVL